MSLAPSLTGVLALALTVGAWMVVATAAVALATQVIGDGTRHPLPVLHALLPWLVAPTVPVAVVAAVTGRLALAITAALVLGGFLALAAPLLVRRPVTADADPDGARLRVLFDNVLYENPDVAGVTDRVLHAANEHRPDVIALAEVTGPLLAALEAAGISRAHPHRSGTPGRGAEACMVWSRLPLQDDREVMIDGTRNVIADLPLDGATCRLAVMHNLPPARRETRHRWAPSLAAVGDAIAESPHPVLIVGDVNAGRWHPVYRTLLARHQLGDAHEHLGRGWTRSWPVSRWIPRLVRLDHALCGPGVTPLEITDVRVTGSDHLGFVVTVAVDRSAS